MHIPNCIRNIWDTLGLFLVLAAIVEVGGFVAYALAPLVPIVTVLFVIGGTVLSFGRKTTATLAIIGLVIYVASWFILPRFGEMISTLICVSGILIWFWAVIQTLASNFPKSKPVSTT
jgi:hypothetical protein